MKSSFLALIFFATFSYQVNGQADIYNIKISGDFEYASMLEILTVIQSNYPVKFYFFPEEMPHYPQSFVFEDTPLREALNRILVGSNMSYSRLEGNKIVILPRNKLDIDIAKKLVKDWDKGKIQLPTSDTPEESRRMFGKKNNQREKVKIFGKINDQYSKEPIIGAVIVLEGLNTGTTTDADGKYELEILPGQHTLRIQYIGYRTHLIHLVIFDDGELDVEMQIQPYKLGEVVVEAKADDNNVQTSQTGIATLSPTKIRELPSFLGEADVIKSLETLAGVSTVGEGATGFNVRGGNIDQNLITYDGALLFNSSHVLGFFSVFNPDAIKNVTLYKGNIPAQFGGRLSSVLEVETKNGDYHKWNGSGGLGLVSSRITVGGPLVKGKTSILFGGRSSYSDWILKEVENPDVSKSSARFYDLNAKINHRFSDKSNLSLSAYQSRDFFRFSDEFGFEWKTRIANLDYRHILNEKLSTSVKAIYSDYNSTQFDPKGFDALNLYSGISYWNIKPSIFYTPNDKHEIVFGGEWIAYDAKPEQVEPRGNISTIAEKLVEKDDAQEVALYINDEITLTPTISISAGLRFSSFFQSGPKTLFQYQDEAPLQPSTISDTILVEKGELIKSYWGLEPRISAKFNLTQTSSIKLSYNRINQYIHLISNTAAATPVDIWQVSNSFIPPQVADNFSIGYFENFQDNLWKLSLEGYYKKIKNLVTYKDLPQLLLNEHLETELLAGEGRAYGVELSVEKTAGKYSGSLAYTYSRSLVQANGDFPEERINRGAWFPANFDQPHQLNLLLKIKVTPIQFAHFSFTYRSGRPISVPISVYQVGTVLVPNYSLRNQFRIPAYHRLDVGYTIDKARAWTKGFRTSFTFSLYNLYGRNNAFSVFFKKDNRGIQRVYQLSILGVTFPALTINFKF